MFCRRSPSKMPRKIIDGEKMRMLTRILSMSQDWRMSRTGRRGVRLKLFAGGGGVDDDDQDDNNRQTRDGTHKCWVAYREEHPAR